MREQVIRDFLDASGWENAERLSMGADWSARRYERLKRGDETAILMDAPGPAIAQVPPFIRICGILRDLSLSAPFCHQADLSTGLLLLEDYGDDTFAALLERGSDPWPLYKLATDVLIHLHRHFSCTNYPDLPRYDGAVFQTQVMLFADAYLPAALGRSLTKGEREGWAEAWDKALIPAFAVPDGLLLRDYHPGNLMALPMRDGVRACGLLDVQDAGIGPVSYDLLSLLEDARRDVDPAIRTAMMERFLTAFPNLNRDAFAASTAALGAVRHARILGRVAELAAGGRSAKQLAFLSRVWRQFHATLNAESLRDLAQLAKTMLPDDGAVPRILGESA